MRLTSSLRAALVSMLALSLVACGKGGNDPYDGDAEVDAQADGTSGDAGMPMFVGVDSLGRLVRFAPTALDSTQTLTITGLQPSETIASLDVRPADGLLYGLGDTSRLYTINPTTGVATPVGAQFSTVLSGLHLAIDINPVADRVRAISNAQNNIRVNPIDGLVVATDANLTLDGAAAHFTECAYMSNFAGAATTTLFAIDTSSDVLAILNPPNAGTGVTIGALGVAAEDEIGFDIVSSGGTDVAYAALHVMPATSSSLYTVNLSTGAVTLVGAIGGNVLHALAYVP